MNRILIVFFAWVVLLGGASTLLAQALPPEPPPTFPAFDAFAPVPPPPDTNAFGKIAFQAPVYDFGKVRAGEIVKHTYVFTNVGNAILNVLNVQPSCGCTPVGEWTKKVEPGHIGTLTVQFNSGNFNGPVLKIVAVQSSDKTQPQLVLQLKGTIWRPVDVSPRFAVLNVPPDAPGTSATVTITNNTDEFITLSPPQSNNRAFAATLVTNTPGKGFSVVVSAVPPLTPGNLQGEISIKTSTTNMPVVSVTVWANVQPPMNILPPRVLLPSGPLGNKSTNYFNIQNNSANALVISEPAFSVPGVEYSIRENSPGRSFSVGLVFPQGFELPPGQQGAFTAKTSNQQMPSIRVPVTHLPRPKTPPAKLAAQVQPRALPVPVPPPPATPSHY